MGRDRSGPADGDAHAAFQAAVANFGIALLPFALVADDLRAGRLKHVFARYRVHGGLFAVYRSNRHMSAALRAFLDFIAIKKLPLCRDNQTAVVAQGRPT